MRAKPLMNNIQKHINIFLRTTRNDNNSIRLNKLHSTFYIKLPCVFLNKIIQKTFYLRSNKRNFKTFLHYLPSRKKPFSKEGNKSMLCMSKNLMHVDSW